MASIVRAASLIGWRPKHVTVAPPTTGAALKFNVATNSQYLPLVAF